MIVHVYVCNPNHVYMFASRDAINRSYDDDLTVQVDRQKRVIGPSVLFQRPAHQEQPHVKHKPTAVLVLPSRTSGKVVDGSILLPNNPYMILLYSSFLIIRATGHRRTGNLLPW